MGFLLRAFISFAFALPALAQLPYPIFGDVPSNKPYYDQVNLLREREVTRGCQVYPAEYCPEPPYTLTRGQAAVLIIRSIYSARTGDPEGFPAPPTTPYFTDVSSDHPQFTYIQKMKELGITQGVTETTFEPWGTLNFAQTAVFTYRARQIRRWEPLTPPAACGGPAFADVPANYVHCPYIREMAGELGYDKAISPNCSTGFCPESIAMNRGILAFYLVNGVMNVGQPQWLPTGGGAVPGVWLPGPPEPDCSHGGPQGDFAFGNQIVVLGGFLYSWANTYVNNPGNPDVWNQYTAMRLYASGNELYSDEDHSAYGANWSGTLSYNYIINPNLNYRNDAWHSVASMCLANGNSWFTSVNNPAIIQLSTPVLYRGTFQNLVIRGSTLQQANIVRLQTKQLPSAMIPSQYQVTASVETPYDTPAGPTGLYLMAISPNDNQLYPTNVLPVTVADPTPVITSITPSVGTQGSTFPATLSGNYFGSNPTVCILVSAGNCVQSFGGVTVTRGACGAWPSCNTLIPITIAIASNAAVISYQIAVLSNGANGSGFQSGGGSQPTPPAPVLLYVQPLIVSQVSKYDGNIVDPLYLSTGDTSGRIITTSVVPSTTQFNVSYTSQLLSNPNSNCTATLSVPSGSATGFINSPVSASAAPCSGIFTVRARANGVDSLNTSAVVVPPQILIQVLYGEANGQPRKTNPDFISQRAIGAAIRNRFSQTGFSGATTYQAAIVTGQFDGIATSILDGPDPELAAAAEVFAGTSSVSVANAGCFFSPLMAGWNAILEAFQSQTTEVPSVIGDPRCYAGDTYGRQLIIKDSIGESSIRIGVPAFIFEQPRPSLSAPAVIRIP